MSSTNKTTNYELSQFVGTDKPAWLSDYNTDMSKIDTQMKANADGVTSATGKADSNTASIGTLSSLTTESKTNLVAAINEVDSHADTAQNTADAASNKAIANETKIGDIEDYFDLDTITNYTSANLSVSGATISTGSTLTIARNTDGTLAKVYGILGISASVGGSKDIVLNVDSGLRPSQEINISPSGCVIAAGQGLHSVSYNILPNGTLTIKAYVDSGSSNAMLFPCVYFMQNFGDE